MIQIKYDDALDIFKVKVGSNSLRSKTESRLLENGGIVGDKTESLIRVLKQEPNTWINLTMEDE